MKKFLALLLLLATLIPLMAGCALEDGSEQGSENDGEGTKQEQLDKLPSDLDYDGEDVVVLNRTAQNYNRDEIAVPELNTEPVNDAMFNRNLTISDRLNVNIVSHSMDDPDPFAVITEIERVVKAGGQDYDLLAGACYVTLASALRGTFYDLSDLEYLDLEQDYWMQDYNESISMDGEQYTATGAIALSTYRLAMLTLFNKEMFEDQGLPSLYEAVQKNEWTLDYQASIVRGFYQDMNGNAVRDEEDLYGFVTSSSLNTDVYWSACDIPMIQKNADGEYVWTMDTGKLSDTVDKLLYLYYESSGTYLCQLDQNDTAQPGIRKMFAEGRAAMTTLRLMAAELDELRNMTQQYGIVPMPKYDANQKEYGTQMHDQFTVFCIPSSVDYGKLEMIGATLEAMASESERTVKPAYYEIAIKRKYMSDPVAWEMLDIAFDNMVIDPGVVYADALDYPHHKLRSIMESKQNAVASQFGSIEKSVNKQLKRLFGQ